MAFNIARKHKRKVIITDLRIDNCGSTFDPVRFIDVRVTTTDDGDLEFSVPFCYRKFGSCVFEDVCSYGRSENACPPILDEHDVPCECPINKN
ncbi:hypothetical protein B566_EDAN013180 [Ephemera danica]|nr:hypothetical protein B566_EDAN013180 [Ephemera danica]